MEAYAPTLTTLNQQPLSEHFVHSPQLFSLSDTPSIPWIEVAAQAPYFITDRGENWTPIGQNDALIWPELVGLFRRKDVKSVEAYLAHLATSGVTCLRLMLEYCHTQYRYIERPVGVFQPNMVQLWDDLFMLCARYGLRILLTPFDTFWMRIRWKHHPYNRAHGGPCSRKSQWLLCPTTLAAMKARLAFATERWGNTGTLFAWDLWNELDPAHAEGSTEPFAQFVRELSTFLRSTELKRHGRAHLQTVSVFGPQLDKNPEMTAVIFRHPQLDFASSHFYHNSSISQPRNTVAPAVQTAHLTRKALAEIHDGRPFLDTEHGPIRSFRKRQGTLAEDFDDEYFRHMQWAHFASGGAGGGMRWPYRHPHTLTLGMRKAQHSLAGFAALVDWKAFNRHHLGDRLKVPSKRVKSWGCGTDKNAIIWLLRTDAINERGMMSQVAEAISVKVALKGLSEGMFVIRRWRTKEGRELEPVTCWVGDSGKLTFTVPDLQHDIALLISAQ